jgi:hypothetical protein
LTAIYLTYLAINPFRVSKILSFAVEAIEC